MVKTLANSSNESTKSMFGLADILSKNLGLSDEATEGFLRYNAIQKSVGSDAASTGLAISKVFADATGEEASTYMKQIGEDIGKAGATARIQFGRVAGSLEVAVLKSRQLGISMADLSATGESLLDIESSVGKELEYQLLTGNRLLTQDGKSITAEYRKAQIAGEGGKQAELMQTILEQEGDTLSKNLFARQQMADLLGMSEEKLAGMLEKQKFISQYGLEEGDIDLNNDELKAKIEEQIAKIDTSTDEGKKEAKLAREELAGANFDTRTIEEESRDSLLAIESNTMLAWCSSS